MTKTCHTVVTWGTVGSSPPVSLLCTLHGGEKSEPGGWPDLSPPSPLRAGSDGESAATPPQTSVYPLLSLQIVAT